MKENNINFNHDLIGKKIGKLAVIDLIEAANGDTVLFCRCECGQNLLLYKEKTGSENSCRKCSFRGKNDYQPNEIVRFITVFSVIPFGEYVIINSRSNEGNNPQFVVEYKGKLVLCRASDLEATGKMF